MDAPGIPADRQGVGQGNLTDAAANLIDIRQLSLKRLGRSGSLGQLERAGKDCFADI